MCKEKLAFLKLQNQCEDLKNELEKKSSQNSPNISSNSEKENVSQNSSSAVIEDSSVANECNIFLILLFKAQFLISLL